MRFEVARADAYPGDGYDLVCHFDCLHDMGDPAGAARHVRETLTPDGWWMVVEPFAGDSLEDNLNPVGRLFYAASTVVCTPSSLSQEVALGLGAQAGPKRMEEIMREAGLQPRARRDPDPVQPDLRGPTVKGWGACASRSPSTPSD